MGLLMGGFTPGQLGLLPINPSALAGNLAGMGKVPWAPDQLGVLVDKVTAVLGDKPATWLSPQGSTQQPRTQQPSRTEGSTTVPVPVPVPNDAAIKVPDLVPDLFAVSPGSVLAGLPKEMMDEVPAMAFALEADTADSLATSLCHARTMHTLKPSQLSKLANSASSGASMDCQEETQIFTPAQKLAVSMDAEDFACAKTCAAAGGASPRRGKRHYQLPAGTGTVNLAALVLARSED